MFAYARPPPSFINDPFFTRGVSAERGEFASEESGLGFCQILKAGDKALTRRYPAFLETAEKNFKKLVDGGVKYGFGTDSGPPGRFPGYLEHWEMELMVHAGLDALAGHSGGDQECGGVSQSEGSRNA